MLTHTCRMGLTEGQVVFALMQSHMGSCIQVLYIQVLYIQVLYILLMHWHWMYRTLINSKSQAGGLNRNQIDVSLTEDILCF